MAGTHEVHGAPLGDDEAKATRAALGWDHGAFDVPSDMRAAWDARAKGGATHAGWDTIVCAATARSTRPEAAAFERRMRGELPERLVGDGARRARAGAWHHRSDATRKSSQQALEKLVAGVPELLGGSADLTWSNLTAVKASRPFDASRRQLSALRRARVRHGGDHERRRAARRLHSRTAARSRCSPTTRARASA